MEKISNLVISLVDTSIWSNKMSEHETKRNVMLSVSIILLVSTIIYAVFYVERKVKDLDKNFKGRKYPEGISTKEEAEKKLWNLACPCGMLECDGKNMDFFCENLYGEESRIV